jgi:hypothetical protein
MSNQTQEPKQDFAKTLGPLTTVNVDIKLPKAFIDYINEVAIKQNKWYKNLGECCSEDLLRIMIADLDKDKNIPLEKYTIPRCIGYYFSEIMDAYGWGNNNETK